MKFWISLLFGDIEKLKVDPNKKSKGRKSWSKRLFLLVVAFIGFASYMHGIKIYSTTDKRVAGLEYSIDLGYETEVKYKVSEELNCDLDSCWNKERFNDKGWGSITLPKNYLKEEKAQNLWAHYRIALKIPKNLIEGSDVIAFSPTYIRHMLYKIYINGNEVVNGNMKEQTSKSLVVSIPRKMISEEGRVLIGIKGTYQEGFESGLSHRGRWLLGKEKDLSSLYNHHERAMGTYYLMYALPKAGIITIFVLIFLFTNTQKGFFSFLLFAIASAIESVLIGEFTDSYLTLDEKIALAFYAKIIGAVGLSGFFLNYYNLRNKNKVYIFIALFSFTTMSVALYLMNNTKIIGILGSLNIANGILSFVLIAAFSIGLVSIKMWKRLEVESKKIIPFYKMAFAVGFYALLVVWNSFFGGNYDGFDLRPIFDLGFFLFIASEVIKGFGVTEERVDTLEGHMIEKLRMQQELEDAREVSRAFIPEQPPEWKDFNLSIFHQQMTENGGDWFGFHTTYLRGQDNKHILDESGEKIPRFHFFFMCDVVGHGVPAALTASTLTTILDSIKTSRWNIREDERFVTEYIKEANQILYKRGGGRNSTTICALAFDLQNMVMHYVCFGHPWPLLKDEGYKYIMKPLTGKRLDNIGEHQSIDVSLSKYELKHGDIISIHTDGFLIEKNLRVITKEYSPFDKNFKDYSNDLYSQLVKIKEKSGKLIVEDEDDLTLVSFHFVGNTDINDNKIDEEAS